MQRESKAGFTNWAVPIKRMRAGARRLLGDAMAVVAFAIVLALLWFFGVGS